MVTEYITNETQGKNSACNMYNTRRVNFLCNGWKLVGGGDISNSESYTQHSRWRHDDHVTGQNIEKSRSSQTNSVSMTQTSTWYKTVLKWETTEFS